MFEPDLNPRQSRIDRVLWLAIFGLMVLGILFVYSATMVSELAASAPWYHQGWFRQIVWCALGVGAAAVLMGVAHILRSSNASTKIVALEPASAPLLSKGFSGTHHVEGIGIGLVPPLLDHSFCDEARGIDLGRFEIFGSDAGVADVGIRESDDLPGVGRIGEDLLIARQCSIENDFAGSIAFGSN